MASCLMRLSPDRAVWVRALEREVVLSSWARHLTRTVPLSTQVYKWVPANLMLGVTLQWTSIPSSGGPAGSGHLVRMQTLPYQKLLRLLANFYCQKAEWLLMILESTFDIIRVENSKLTFLHSIPLKQNINSPSSLQVISFKASLEN